MHRFLVPQVDGKSVHGNVVFNWRGNPIDDLVAYANGYRLAARSLAASFREQGAYADYEGYPILFLCRHAIELFLHRNCLPSRPGVGAS